MFKKTIVLSLIILVVVSASSYFYFKKDKKVDTNTKIYSYKEYVAFLDTICPFTSTAMQTDCLDGLLDKQVASYKDILLKIDPKLNVDEYIKAANAHVGKICQMKHIDTQGSGILAESRQCALYYTSLEINFLNSTESTY